MISAMLIDLFRDVVSPRLLEHAHRLTSDSDYRKEHVATVKAAPLETWYASPIWTQTMAFIRRSRKNPEYCECCGKKRPTQGHHKDKNYVHLGLEVLYPEDIALICDECHRNEHGILPFDAPAISIAIPSNSVPVICMTCPVRGLFQPTAMHQTANNHDRVWYHDTR
jgi:hypothetical protein